MRRRLLLTLLCVALLVCLTGCGNKVTELDEEVTKSNIAMKINYIKKVVVLDANNNEVKTVSTKEDIEKIVNIISTSTEINENIEHEGNTWFISMYINDGKLICTISMWKSGYLGFGKTAEKEYKISTADINEFKELLKK